MQCCCVALVLSILSACPLHAQENARALIAEVVATYKAAKTYHFETASDNEMTSEWHRSWSSSRQTLARDRSERFRFEVSHVSGSYAVVSDGKTLWRAAHDTREFIQNPVTGPILDTKGGGPLAQSGLSYLKAAASYLERWEDHLQKAERLRDESIEVGGSLIECAVVRADYAPPRGATGIDHWARTLWIDKRRKIVLHEENVSRGKLDPTRPYAQMQTRHTIRHTVASIGEPLPDSLFVYNPPASYREVDKLERASPRPAKDLIGKPAPELSLQTLTGDTVKLSDFRGKVVLLDFWAAWCAPCRAQMPAIASLYRQVKDQGLVVLGVNDDESPEEALKFLAGQAYDWPHLFDGKQKQARDKYKVAAIPALVLIDKLGAVADYQVGAGEAAATALREALQKQGFQLAP